MDNLERDYGLRTGTLRPVPGGFASDCLVADERWFVKIWRGAVPPAGLDLLQDLRATGLPVPTPIPAGSGELHAWWDGRPYAVFPFVRGRAARDDDWPLTVRAMRRVHEAGGVDLPPCDLDEPHIWLLRERLDHPWIAGRAREVEENIERLRSAISRARAKTVPHVVCHRDFGGANLLIDGGAVVAILDWEQAVIGPREHDLWSAADGADGERVLTAYGARDLDLDHLEYALLARALRDMAARVLTETDRPGIETWGFARIAGLDRNLEMFSRFCA